MRRLPLLLAFALLSTTAHAQAVFRSVMPDGKIVYGDKPAPGAKESKQVNLPAPNVSTSTQPAADPAAQQQPASAGNSDVKSAQQTLDAAKAALEAGRDPQPGERTGTAGGMSRLNESYFQRIKGLEDAVTAAQTQFDNARRNAGR